MRHILVRCFLFGILAIAPLAEGDQYPHKPIRFIVPYGAGGNTDIVARAVAEKLSQHLGQQVIVDNRGGAGGTIGTELAAQATPDGCRQAGRVVTQIGITTRSKVRKIADTTRRLVMISGGQVRR